jgi:hypothetical protein
VLERDFGTVEEAAKAALAEAFAIASEKGRFTVVGQLMWSGGFIDHADAAASKIALGHYATQKQAQSAAESLVISTRSHEEMRAWVLDVHNGTPASYFQARIDERKRLDMLGKTGLEARLARRSAFFVENPGALILPPEIDDPWEV